VEDFPALSLPDLAQAAVIGDRFVQVVANEPAMSQIEIHRLHQLALGANAFEESDQLEPEEHHRIDGRTPEIRIELGSQIAYEAQVDTLIDLAIEVVLGDQILQGNRHMFLEISQLMTQHAAPPECMPLPVIV
jgi:hypothetical protein